MVYSLNTRYCLHGRVSMANFSIIFHEISVKAFLRKNFCLMCRTVNRTEVEVNIKGTLELAEGKSFGLSKIRKQKKMIVTEIMRMLFKPRVYSRIFQDKTIKTNFPRNHPCPPKLQEHLSTVNVCTAGAKPNPQQSNLSKEQWAAIRSLQRKQKECEIIIKPSDKTGEVCFLDYDPYVKVRENKLAVKLR